MYSIQNDYFTYQEIADIFGVTKGALAHRVHRLGIKGRTLSDDGTIFFTVKQVAKITACYSIKAENHPRKLDVIELYHKGYKGRVIAEVLKMSAKLSYDCIREYRQTGCVIVESKLNSKRLKL